MDWLKDLVGDRKAEQVVDPKLPKAPPPKALKRVLLVALRCVDPDAQKRPKMGHVVHMLEMDELLSRDVRSVFSFSSCPGGWALSLSLSPCLRTCVFLSLLPQDDRRQAPNQSRRTLGRTG